MKVLSMTYDELNALHQSTGCGYFKNLNEYVPSEEGEEPQVRDVCTGAIQMIDGKYVFNVDVFIRKHPNVNISGLTQIDYVPQEKV